MTQKKVAILFGGKSPEHEISLRSAASIIQHIDTQRFLVKPIFIDKLGLWWEYEISALQVDPDTLMILPQPNAKPFSLLPTPSGELDIDVVFPVMHGKFCEDGAMQGLLELTELPYVGPDILSSSLGMDKPISKILMREAGIPVAPFVVVHLAQWQRDKEAAIGHYVQQFSFPCFVKPINTGSSVGVSKVNSLAELPAAIDLGLQYHDSVILEEMIVGRELEIAALENIDPSQPPLTSLPGEIVVADQFYSYDLKYLNSEKATFIIPAEISLPEVGLIQTMVRTAFEVLRIEGLARIDFFIESDTGKVYFNEANTMPGFTRSSLYPILWQASGMSYPNLITQLIELAIARHTRRQRWATHFNELQDLTQDVSHSDE